MEELSYMYSSKLINEKEYKYKCEKCNYNTNIKLSYDRHLKSYFHITGERKIRSDKKNIIYKCECCIYETNNKNNYKTHKLNNHSSNEEKKNFFYNYCEKCNFGCFSNTSYLMHLETKKHKIKT